MESMKTSDSMDSCPVCLQTYLYPTQLPCGHTFCFLCVKGSTNQNKGCPLCRQEIPGDFLKNPKLLDIDPNDHEISNEVQWFYEGRNNSGWWKYDPRTNCEINSAVSNGAERCELLIADSLYIIDFVNCFQYRKNDPHRKRKIKSERNAIPISTKGVAGIKFMSNVEIINKTSENAFVQELDVSDESGNTLPYLVDNGSFTRFDLDDIQNIEELNDGENMESGMNMNSENNI